MTKRNINSNSLKTKKVTRDTHIRAIKLAFKALASPKPPKATLRHAMKKDCLSNHSGSIMVLSSYEEEQLVGYCKNMQSLGFGLTRLGVNTCMMSIVKSDGREHLFKDDGSGKTWWAHFIKDYSDLSFQIHQALLEAHAQRVNSIIIKDHFDKLYKIIQNNSLTPDSPKVQKVLVEKGTHQVHKVAHSNSHNHISVASTTLAASDYIPLLIIYKSVCAISGLLNGTPSGMVIGFTDSKYMCKELFQMYIEHFISSIPPCRPVLLMLNSHSSHINYMSINFCHKNGILLYALPLHTTHILQPSGLSFTKLKTKYSKNCNQLHNITGKLVTKYIFAKMLSPVFIKTYTLTTISNAFRTTGIWPFNPNAISLHCLNSSLTIK
ncbi:12268_t:CDS:2 [Cetraspora pellucida]|uniref:12268_t:CDS:1 n=1 Tax=Cetraspora pellucida TaxID=1433469 RepID=A0A9N9H9K2_9GLOM|nr:12268_t:CDS:2 [Cetraspora pellucida]